MKPEKNNYLIPFILVTSLFFLWGISNNLTGILIPHLRKALLLTITQSTFVDTAVYLAYFLAAIPAGLIINKYGYKIGIITELLGFFMSIMFPTIFSLGIKDLNENTKPASSLIVMSIIGGAIFSVIMDKIIDNYEDDIQKGYIVPLMCFFVVLYFGIKGHKPKTQT